MFKRILHKERIVDKFGSRMVTLFKMKRAQDQTLGWALNLQQHHYNTKPNAKNSRFGKAMKAKIALK